VTRIKPNTGYRSLNIALLLFPCWLMLFYFKESLAQWLVYNLFSFDGGEKFLQSLVFFISTLLKISLLLVLVIFLISLARSWVPMDKIRNRLKSMPSVPAHFLAGLFGVITPFCSCSAVPLFIGFLETGIPLGITFSFLIASPLVNEIIIIMLAGLFGLKVAIVYLLAGITVAVVSGYIIGKLQLERYLPDWLLNFRNVKIPPPVPISLDTRILHAYKTVQEVVSRTWMYILAGIIVGAAIHGYVPDDLLNRILGKENWYAMPLAVLTGIPLYACSASVAPIAFALADKGMPLGTSLAFIMAVAGLSLPEFIMLKKVLSLRLMLIFIGIVFTGILLVGYFFNKVF